MQAPTNFEVIVVGGGTAGVAAALTASRLGARTLLLERETRLGGNAANAFVHTICGLYRAADEGEAIPLHPGLPQRIARELIAVGAAGAPERAGRVVVLPIEPARYSAYLGALCERTPGLAVKTECALDHLAFPSTGDSATVTVRDRSCGVERLNCRIVIDASGDAAAATACAAPVLEAEQDQLQLPSFIFRIGAVDRGAAVGFATLRITHALARAARVGDLPRACESVLVRPGARADEVYVTLNVPRPAERYTPMDSGQLATMTDEAHDGAEQVAAFLRHTRPEFSTSRIVAYPDRIGVRETRRVAGRYEITRDDILEGREDVDEVARSSWPIELWHEHRRAHFEYPAGACSIPLDALVGRTQPRLGMAGRCLSASHEALGALRVIGTALATGEAVGVAAALAADRHTALDAIAADEVREQIVQLAGVTSPR